MEPYGNGVELLTRTDSSSSTVRRLPTLPPRREPSPQTQFTQEELEQIELQRQQEQQRQLEELEQQNMILQQQILQEQQRQREEEERQRLLEQEKQQQQQLQQQKLLEDNNFYDNAGLVPDDEIPQIDTSVLPNVAQVHPSIPLPVSTTPPTSIQAPIPTSYVTTSSVMAFDNLNFQRDEEKTTIETRPMPSYLPDEVVKPTIDFDYSTPEVVKPKTPTPPPIEITPSPSFQTEKLTPMVSPKISPSKESIRSYVSSVHDQSSYKSKSPSEHSKLSRTPSVSSRTPPSSKHTPSPSIDFNKTEQLAPPKAISPSESMEHTQAKPVEEASLATESPLIEQHGKVISKSEGKAAELEKDQKSKEIEEKVMMDEKKKEEQKIQGAVSYDTPSEKAARQRWLTAFDQVRAKIIEVCFISIFFSHRYGKKRTF